MRGSSRVRCPEDRPVHPEGDYVLYWMTAARRARSSFALDRAIEWAKELGKALWVVEALRFDHAYASARMQTFVIQGMRDNAEAFSRSPIGYYPYVEPEVGAGKGMLEAFMANACVVVTDDWPVYFLRRATLAAARRSVVRFELVDGAGIVPMSAPDRCFARAHDFRRWLQKNSESWLGAAPQRDPLSRLKLPRPSLPKALRAWPAASPEMLGAPARWCETRPWAHRVDPVALPGGAKAARERLDRFVAEGLERYGERNQPQSEVTSGLSPYLHFGHVGAHEVFDAVVATQDDWSPARLSDQCKGQREGWWGMSPGAEGFMDQLLTWREVGHNFVWHRDDYDQYDSLPSWAKGTLSAHAGDERPWRYDLDEFEAADTHDEIWNAAQRELVRTGRMHNYLRMLWGKKILHWSASPREALRIMIHLNDKYALDGRDPNSYSGMFWVLGRYDRAWGPEREVFGKIRYMSSDSTRRKIRLGDYLVRFGARSRAEADAVQGQLFEGGRA